MPGESLPWPRTRTTPLPEADGSPVAIDFKCVTCGYNLRGLSSTSTCPECALPISHSIYGGSLTTAAPEFRTAIITGLACITYAGLAYLPILWVWLVSRTIGYVGLRDAGTYASLTAQLAIVTGVWLITTPDAGYNGDADPGRARRAARYAASIVAAMIAAQVLIMLLTTAVGPAVPLLTATPIISIAKFLGWCVIFFAAMHTIEWIATRVPLPKVARRCTLFRWLVPAIPVTFIVGATALGSIAITRTRVPPGPPLPGTPAFAPPPMTATWMWVLFVLGLLLLTLGTAGWLWWTLSTLRAAVRKIHTHAQQPQPANTNSATEPPSPSPAST